MSIPADRSARGEVLQFRFKEQESGLLAAQAPETTREENFLSEQRSCGPKAVVVRSDRSVIHERKKKIAILYFIELKMFAV